MGGGCKYADELYISVTDDHSRITLKAENNHGNSDYINASPIVSIVCVLPLISDASQASFLNPRALLSLFELKFHTACD